MKKENKAQVEKICQEIDRIEKGISMMESAKKNNWALTFGVSTSDALGFKLSEAHLFKMDDIVDIVIYKAKKQVEELTAQLDLL